MLQHLKIKNFSSFRDEQEFVLESPRTTRDDRRFLRVNDNDTLALASVIFGGNASGKTNFLRALPFLAGFIKNSWPGLKPGEPIPCLPFLFSRDSCLTEFEISAISSQGTRYVYQLGLDDRKVHFEHLNIKDCGARTFSRLFKRSFDSIKLYPKSGFKLGDLPRKSLRENTSFISTALQSDITIFNEFIDAFQIVTNISMANLMDIDKSGIYLYELYSNKHLKHIVTETIRKCDTGISDFEIFQEDLSEQDKADPYTNLQNAPFFNIQEFLLKGDLKSYKIMTSHYIDGVSYNMPLLLESDGIKRLFPLLTIIYHALNSAAIMVLDEIEKGLHPQLVQFILDLFYDEELNKRHAQLICTTHSADCMNF